MTPENGKCSVASLRKGRGLVASSVIALLATSLVGIANPAQAVEQGATKAADPYVRSGDDGDKDKDKDKYKDKDKDKEKGKKDHDGRPKPPRPQPGPCYSIDSDIQGDDQYLVAVQNGDTSAGIRKINPPTDDVDWVDLTTLPMYPGGVCDATVAVKSGGGGSPTNDVLIEVITTNGQVYQTFCSTVHAGDDSLLCNTAWALTVNQP